MDEQQTSEAIAEWNARGVIVLPKFYADAEIDAVLADYRALWHDGRARVTVDDMDLGRRLRLRDVTTDARAFAPVQGQRSVPGTGIRPPTRAQ